MKVVRVNLWGAKILNAVKGGEFGRDLGRSKEELEGLACLFHSRSQRVERQPLKRWKNRTWLPVIQREAASRRLDRDKAERSAEGLQGEIRNDPKPREKRRLLKTKTSIAQLRREGLAFKINRCVGDAPRNGD